MAVDSELTVTTVAVIFSGIAFMGFWREMNDLKKQVITWMSRIETTLFGASGSNGLNGISKDHEERMRQIERRIGDAD
jgi:hypothetical protein